MSAKYQIKTLQGISYFRKKSDFIEHCQLLFKENRLGVNYKKKTDVHFSYDNGITWNHIENFKTERQIIQNEKNPQIQNEVTPDKNSKQTSWFTYLVYIFFIWSGLSYFNIKVNKIGFINDLNGSVFGWNSKFVREGSHIEKLNQDGLDQETVKDEESSEANPSNELSNQNGDYPNQEDANSQTDYNDYSTQSSNDNSSSNTYKEPERQYQPERQRQEPEKTKCNSCNGSGNCPTCSKSQQDGYYNKSGSYIRINEVRMGMVICRICHGSGVFMKENECGWCKGQGWDFCKVCNYNGRGNNSGKCQSCKGSGMRN